MGTEQITAVMESLKTSGIGSAFIQKDGSLVYATIKLEDVSAGILANISNVADTLLKRAKDEQKEFELVVDSDLLVVIPIKGYYLCAILKSRDQKKLLRDSAEKIKAVV